ncbi:MAG: MGMT family protein [Patescibacteria group bacterium]|jgi:O-6-methylguanine DNA methyltransferase
MEKDINLTAFEKRVLSAIKAIKKGRVSTYKEVAKKIGAPGAGRAVGNTLNKNPWAPEVPCHRIVRSDGRIGGYAGGKRKKIKLLKEEGVIVRNNKIEGFNAVLMRL